MLAEFHRVLKPGGRVRIATPNLGRLAALASPGHALSPEATAYVAWIAGSFLGDPSRATPAFALNQAFHGWGHEFLFDEGTLAAELERAGFEAVQRHAVGESEDAHLRGLETHGRAVGNPAMVAFETLVLEARRPRS